jgi:hypothetical protein
MLSATPLPVSVDVAFCSLREPLMLCMSTTRLFRLMFLIHCPTFQSMSVTGIKSELNKHDITGNVPLAIVDRNINPFICIITCSGIMHTLTQDTCS